MISPCDVGCVCERCKLAHEIVVADNLSLALAHRDVALYLKIISGAPVPIGLDVEALMDRVDLWERQRIFEIADHENGSYWWAPLMLTCIYDAWRRKVGEAMARGESWRVLTTTALSAQALGATSLLLIRQIFFPLVPIGLQPLRFVLAFTS